MAEKMGEMDKFFASLESDDFLRGVETKEVFDPNFFEQVSRVEGWANYHSAKTGAEFGVMFPKNAVKKGKCHVRLHALNGIKVNEFARHKMTLTPGKRGQVVITHGWN